MRYFITFSYDGTQYHGWQIQPHDHSVQEKLQQALSVLLRSEVEIVGAGRTDAGVHARMMVAHFDWPASLDTNQLVYRLNRILPPDIAVQTIRQVDDSLHARFSATRRTYQYYVHTCKDPFVRPYSCELHYPLDFSLMNQAARILMEYDDFGAFCKSHTDVKTTICHLFAAEWHQQSPSRWYFEISANRFLRNMVRAVVGTLVDVGRHRLTLAQFREVIESKRRTKAGESMPAQALFLVDIQYGEADNTGDAAHTHKQE